ncbi:MAG: sulfotransferase [Bryobacteraceae bacterium]|jgi:hypothetical protein
MEHLLANRRKGEFLPAGEIVSFTERLMADTPIMRGEAAGALAPPMAHAMSILLAAEERGRVPEAGHAEMDRLRCVAEEREEREGRHPAVLQSRAAESVTGGGENLIFVISQPRAGSTMLQRVLSAHPEIHTVSEPWIALHPLFALRTAGIAADYNSDLARTATRDFLGRLPEGEEAYWEGVRRMLTHLYGRALGEAGKRIFLDKTPRYYFVIPELRRVFPRARFLFLLRNPLAVLSSILETWVRTDSALDLRNFRHDLMAAPALLLAGIRSFGPTATVARYEELTAEPEKAVRRLCSEIGIGFYPEMIEYGAAAGGEQWQFGDQGVVYRENRPMPGYAERWRSVLKQSPAWEGWARCYLEALGPDLVRDLGYDYSGLSAEFAPLPTSRDWETITQSDAEAQAFVRGQIGSARQQEQALVECQARLHQLESERDRLAGENQASLQRIRTFEEETLRECVLRHFRGRRRSVPH